MPLGDGVHSGGNTGSQGLWLAVAWLGFLMPGLWIHSGHLQQKLWTCVVPSICPCHHRSWDLVRCTVIQNKTWIDSFSPLHRFSYCRNLNKYVSVFQLKYSFISNLMFCNLSLLKEWWHNPAWSESATSSKWIRSVSISPQGSTESWVRLFGKPKLQYLLWSIVWIVSGMMHHHDLS